MREIVFRPKEGLTQEQKNELCLSCQWCCRNILMRVPAIDEPFMQFYHAWGVHLEMFDGLLFAVLPHKCQHITEKGCGIYDKRPVVCRGANGSDEITKMRCQWYEPYEI